MSVNKFAPLINQDTRPFWESCREGRLTIQKCSDCGTYRHPPSPVCHRCRSARQEWESVAGKGRVWTYAVVREPLDGWPGELPLVVAIVELDEGVKLISNVATDPDSVRIGMEVEVYYEAGLDGTVLPKFRPITT